MVTSRSQIESTHGRILYERPVASGSKTVEGSRRVWIIVSPAQSKP